MKITQPLKEEHKEFIPKIEALEELAVSINSLSPQELEKKLSLIINFLQNELIPHAAAEDSVLYPLIDTLSNCKDFTKAMKYDHEEIGELTHMLVSADQHNKQVLQKLLYKLSAIISLHFKKEEEIYLPFLDKNLQQEDAQELFKSMEETAAKIKLSQN